MQTANSARFGWNGVNVAGEAKGGVCAGWHDENRILPTRSATLENQPDGSKDPGEDHG